MATITAAMVKDLRETTGVGMMDCKQALSETQGDMQAAIDWLRKKGLSKAAKKAGRVAAEGLIGAQTAGTKGVVVEVNSETDFVARNEQFQKLVRDLAIQVAGMRADYVDADSIPADVLAAKRAELLADESVQKKPEAIREQIVEGQLKKWYSHVSLLDQPYRDTEQTVRDIITNAIATIGENIRVRRFTRYELGEEL